jgi:hypothetical protein
VSSAGAVARNADEGRAEGERELVDPDHQADESAEAFAWPLDGQDEAWERRQVPDAQAEAARSRHRRAVSDGVDASSARPRIWIASVAHGDQAPIQAIDHEAPSPDVRSARRRPSSR